ncbi:helix-turn-helix domain-containing protein, partial [Nonomuraea sp. NPDC055795]
MEPSGALERGLTVLRVVTAAPERRWRATDLVQATGLARATVDRVLAFAISVGLGMLVSEAYFLTSTFTMDRALIT